MCTTIFWAFRFEFWSSGVGRMFWNCKVSKCLKAFVVSILILDCDSYVLLYCCSFCFPKFDCWYHGVLMSIMDSLLLVNWWGGEPEREGRGEGWGSGPKLKRAKKWSNNSQASTATTMLRMNLNARWFDYAPPSFWDLNFWNQGNFLSCWNKITKSNDSINGVKKPWYEQSKFRK